MRLPVIGQCSRKTNISGKCDKIVKKQLLKTNVSPPQQHRKITRTKTGCLCCRRRKKKCDELKPGCSGCLRNNLKCVYPHIEDHIHQTDKMAAHILSEMASTSASSSSSDVPQMSLPSSPHHSDIESPITSPRLAPHEPIKFVLPLSIDTLKTVKRTYLPIVNPISIKSLLN